MYIYIYIYPNTHMVCLNMCYVLIYTYCSSNIDLWCGIAQIKGLRKVVHYNVYINIDFPFAVHVCDRLCNVVLAYLPYR